MLLHSWHYSVVLQTYDSSKVVLLLYHFLHFPSIHICHLWWSLFTCHIILLLLFACFFTVDVFLQYYIYHIQIIVFWTSLLLITLVCPNLYWLWSMSKDPRSFSAPFLLSMNWPSGMAAGFRMRYLKNKTERIPRRLTLTSVWNYAVSDLN